jgi:hypothetical protein
MPAQNPTPNASAPSRQDRREAVPKRQHTPANDALASDRRVENVLDRVAALSAKERALVADAMADRWGVAATSVEEPAAGEDNDNGPSLHDECLDVEIEGGESARIAMDNGSDAAALDGADGKQGCTDAMTEPDGIATTEEAKPPETPDPEEREDVGQEVAQVCWHRPETVATPVELQIYPDADPYSNKAPLWVRGALQSIGPLTQELSTLEHIPNCSRITEVVLQLIDALAPVCLENPITVEKREKIVSLLRYCGYKNFADQLLHHWAEADAAIAEAQTEMLCQESSPSG